MIFDHVEHIDRYSIPYIEYVKEFLSRGDIYQLTQPEIELRGRDVFVRIMRYVPKSAVLNKFETHRTYADIQVVLQGRELMQVAPSEDLRPLTEYDVDKDYQFFEAKKSISDLVVDYDHFAVFFPGEAHRPSCLVDEADGEVLKFVFKIRV